MNFALGLIIIGAYLLIHNEWLLHDNNLSKRFEVIAWRCFAGAVILTAGVVLL